MEQNRPSVLFLLILGSFLGLTLLSGVSGCGPCGPAVAHGPLRWYKGNTHTHSLWSDGDAAPEHIADWYKSHGYDFLVLSDHNILLQGEKWVKVGPGKGRVPPEHLADLARRFGAATVELREKAGLSEMKLKTLTELRRRFEEPGRFLFIHGEEITDKFMEQVGGKEVERPVHHGSFNHVDLIPPPHGASVREVLERTMAAVEAEAKKCGRPVLVHLNHPNFGWGVTPDDLARVPGERYFEVYNGHRGVRNYGDADHLSTEKIWDYVLTLRLTTLGGPPLYAFATDDAHSYHVEQGISNPGRGWVMVRADALDASTLTEAMLRGDFYATSGVVLDEVAATRESLSIRIAAQPGVSYRTKFIGTRKGGAAGELLQEVEGAAASYVFKGDEVYVRATVVSTAPHPNGYEKGDLQTAWVQPVVRNK
ncbi:MAG TPA: histidinol-phosphatase [Planctomycetota bacterium]|nr:histidinol-phosphatase [Planctomycetota bacterium]